MNKYLPLFAAAFCIGLNTAGAANITDGLTVSGTNPSSVTATINGPLDVNGEFSQSNSKIDMWTSTNMFNLWSNVTNYNAQADFFLNETATDTISRFAVRTFNNSWSSFSAINLSTGWSSTSGHHAVIFIQEPVTQAATTYIDGTNLSFFKNGTVVGRQKPGGATPARVDTMVVALEELANGSAPPTPTNAMRVTKKGQILIKEQGDLSMGLFTAGTVP